MGEGGGGLHHSNPFESNDVITEHNDTGLDVPPEMFDYAEEDEDSADDNAETGDADEGATRRPGDGQQRRRNKIVAGAARSKVSRSSESSLGMSSSTRTGFTACLLYVLVLTNGALARL